MALKPLNVIGSPGRTRTSDPVVNSHLLYRLSYRGSERSAPMGLADRVYIATR
jgi:hypothetical protein